MEDTTHPNENRFPGGKWVVLKFGGTSVSSAERWEVIAKIVRERISEGYRPLLVCSALSQVSNWIEQAFLHALEGADPTEAVETLTRRHESLASALGIELPDEAHRELRVLKQCLLGISMTREASPRLQARVLATGELLSSRIGSVWLSTQGLPTRWLDARDLLRSDPNEDNEFLRYLSARCEHGDDAGLHRLLDASSEPVSLTQGFLARGPEGDTVLLGRGGSDTSATTLGAKIGAAHVEIWTDVPGLFTADPRVVPEARKLTRVGYDEASELATRGAKVLHPRSLTPARESGLPIHIRNTGDASEAGTIIEAGVAAAEPSALAISSRKGMTLISMDVEGTWQQVGVISEISACFAQRGFSIDSIASSQTRVAVSLDPAANPLDEKALEALLHDLTQICRPLALSPVASISVVGTHLRCVLHDLPSLFRVFESYDVHLVSHAAHDHSLTFVVDEGFADSIVRELHGELVGAPSWAAR